jgi:hypothetical protein
MGLGRRWWASVGLLSVALWLAIADFAAILLWGYTPACMAALLESGTAGGLAFTMLLE